MAGRAANWRKAAWRLTQPFGAATRASARACARAGRVSPLHALAHGEHLLSRDRSRATAACAAGATHRGPELCHRDLQRPFRSRRAAWSRSAHNRRSRSRRLPKDGRASFTASAGSDICGSPAASCRASRPRRCSAISSSCTRRSRGLAWQPEMVGRRVISWLSNFGAGARCGRTRSPTRLPAGAHGAAPLSLGELSRRPRRRAAPRRAHGARFMPDCASPSSRQWWIAI